MIIFFILGLVLGAITVVFTLQNIAIVTVSFFGWQLAGSISVVVALSVLMGMLIILLLLLPETIGSYFGFRKLKKENEALQEELKKQKELTLFAKNTPPTSEEIAKIEQGAIVEERI